MRYILPALALLALSAPAFAQQAPAPAPQAAIPVPANVTGAEEAAIIKATEDYLNNLSTLKARFIQTSNDGQRVAGNFYLKRPGKMRFEYDQPIKDFIVADGTFIYYYDSQLKEQKNAPISQSLADFFLRKNLRLSGDVKVSDVKRYGDQFQVTVAQSKDPLAGTLSLVLEAKPQMALKKWRVVDAQGQITEVELYEAQTGIKLDNELFRYYDPKRRETKYN